MIIIDNRYILHNVEIKMLLWYNNYRKDANNSNINNFILLYLDNKIASCYNMSHKCNTFVIFLLLTTQMIINKIIMNSKESSKMLIKSRVVKCSKYNDSIFTSIFLYKKRALLKRALKC